MGGRWWGFRCVRASDICFDVTSLVASRMPLHRVDSESLRADCRRTIENLERWLRRLIDQMLNPVQADYLRMQINGSFVFSKSIRENVCKKAEADRNRYPRPIDAATFEETIEIVTNAQLYMTHFSKALRAAYPEGREVCRTHLDRLVEPRNRLSHANEISVRDAERIVCYSNDLISSIKDYYGKQGMEQDFNVPTIVSYRDSTGRSFSGADLKRSNNGELMLWRSTVPVGIDSHPPFLVLRCGEVVSFEVDVDPSFDGSTYRIEWNVDGDVWARGKQMVRVLDERDVRQHLVVLCRVISDKSWHRLGGSDDVLYVHLTVLPPVE